MCDALLLWDFDGTLAWREGLWSGCVIEVLDEHLPGHAGTLERVRRELREVFPWHRHAQPHPELSEQERWWAALTPSLARAIAACGVEPGRATTLAGEVRARFTDASRGWRVFPDSRAALGRAAAEGWRNVILSNHVPELERLVEQLGLGEHVERVFSSALTGFEKPHPQAFLHALRECGAPSRRWMIGDNPLADGAGASALGIPVVLIRGGHRGGRGPGAEGLADRVLRAEDAVHAVSLVLTRPR